MDWEIYPNGLFDLLVRVKDDYDPPPIYITENGAAFGDHTTHDREVNDPERQAYIEAHLDAISRAIEAGVPMARLLRLVAARQLRVGARVLEALRDRLRRLPDARARAEGELPWYRDYIAASRNGPTDRGRPAERRLRTVAVAGHYITSVE